MKRMILLTLCLCTFISVFPISSSAYSEDYDWERFKGKNAEINVYNWGEYISIDEGNEGDYDTVSEFEKLTGINVNYTTFASNEELYAKLQSGGANYDVVIPSDYMIGRLINEDMLLELNYDNIPNVKYIDERFKDPLYDPYSVPYTWGYVGLIYNKTMIDDLGELESWDIMWNEKYANNILMFNNSRDAFAISLFREGYSVNTSNLKQLEAAARELEKQKPIVQSYVMDEVFDKMGGGEAALAPYYAGDAITMMEDNPDLGFAVPKEGTNLFTDSMCIPKGAQNKEAAEMFINFMCETETALRNIEYICYSTPHTEAFKLLPEDVQNNGIYYPDLEKIKTERFYALPETTTKQIDKMWTDIMTNTNTSPWLTPIFLVAALGFTAFINVRRTMKKKQNEL
ncbi:MAG: ABC transporter substrate-binding protein [Clostridia bacterium]|nr:ABC transporter substrate-binding protein [Clostridia bacterium]